MAWKQLNWQEGISISHWTFYPGACFHLQTLWTLHFPVAAPHVNFRKMRFQTRSYFCPMRGWKQSRRIMLGRPRDSKGGKVCWSSSNKPHNLRKWFVDVTVDTAIEYYFAAVELQLLLSTHSRWLEVGNFYESHLYHSAFHVNSDNKTLNCSRNKMQILQMGFAQ